MQLGLAIFKDIDHAACGSSGRAAEARSFARMSPSAFVAILGYELGLRALRHRPLLDGASKIKFARVLVIQTIRLPSLYRRNGNKMSCFKPIMVHFFRTYPRQCKPSPLLTAASSSLFKADRIKVTGPRSDTMTSC